MSWVAAAAVVVGAIIQSNAASDAADAALSASQQATKAQLQMFNTINEQQAPYLEAGKTALSQMSDLTSPTGAMSHQFTNADLMSNLSPNYQWQLGQGLGALNNQMNVTGGVNSGNTLKAINDYAQNFAGNAYQNAFNNYQTQQANIFNRLSNLAGLGSGANQMTSQAGLTIAGNIGQNIMAGGQAQAAGIMGSANAISGGIQNAGSWYAYQKMMQGMNK